MEQPVQALIAAGGFGTRMGLSDRTPSSKSLAVLNGKTLISRLLYSLSKSGYEEIIVAIHQHSEEGVRKEVERGPRFKRVQFIRSEKGFRRIPSDAKKYLHSRFLFVCGHHPVSVEHLKNMNTSSHESTFILTGYRYEELISLKKERFVFENGAIGYSPILEGGGKRIYVRNPFISDHTPIFLSERDNFKKSFSSYLFDRCLGGESYCVLQASFPPEVDTRSEFENLSAFLNTSEAI